MGRQPTLDRRAELHGRSLSQGALAAALSLLCSPRKRAVDHKRLSVAPDGCKLRSQHERPPLFDLTKELQLPPAACANAVIDWDRPGLTSLRDDLIRRAF